MQDTTPPPYSTSFYLEPIGPDEDGRYGCTDQSQYQEFTFPAGQSPGREPVPDPWVEYINPEGLPYFHNPVRRVVTEANIRVLAIVTAINSAVEYVLAKFTELTGNEWNNKRMELYIQLDIATQFCRYYFVDHEKSSLFWLTEVSSAAIRIPATASVNVAGIYLTEKYWVHTEFFCMHLSFPETFYQETSAILKFHLADVYTSSESTSPYGAGEAEKFIKLLDSFTDNAGSRGYRTWVTARVRNGIEVNRAINLYGEANARMSCFQPRIKGSPVKIRVVPLSWVFNSILMGRPTNLNEEITNLWVDKVTYNRQWRPFAEGIVKEAKQKIYWSKAVIILSSVLLWALIHLKTDTFNLLISFALSLELCALLMGLLTMCLSIRQENIYSKLSVVNAEKAGNYLDGNYHSSYGFYPLAIQISLPSGTLCWSVIYLAIGSSLVLVETLRVSLDQSTLVYALVIPTFLIAFHSAIAILFIFKTAFKAIRRRFTRIALPMNLSDLDDNRGLTSKFKLRINAAVAFAIVVAILFVTGFLVIHN